MPGVPQQIPPQCYVPMQQAYTQPRRSDDTLAIVSLVLGVFSWFVGFVFWLFGLGIFMPHFAFAIPAVVCGHIQRSRIKRDPGGYGGGGLAVAGIVMGYVNIVLSLIGVAIILLFFAAFIGLGIIGAAASQ